MHDHPSFQATVRSLQRTVLCDDAATFTYRHVCALESSTLRSSFDFLYTAERYFGRHKSIFLSVCPRSRVFADTFYFRLHKALRIFQLNLVPIETTDARWIHPTQKFSEALRESRCEDMFLEEVFAQCPTW